jgi:hypothetical protein
MSSEILKQLIALEPVGVAVYILPVVVVSHKHGFVGIAHSNRPVINGQIVGNILRNLGRALNRYSRAWHIDVQSPVVEEVDLVAHEHGLCGRGGRVERLRGVIWFSDPSRANCTSAPVLTKMYDSKGVRDRTGVYLLDESDTSIGSVSTIKAGSSKKKFPKSSTFEEKTVSPMAYQRRLRKVAIAVMGA